MAEPKHPLRKMIVAAILSALTAALAFSPAGFIPGPLGASYTSLHVPTIIAAILEGPLVGMIVGLVFGLVSLFVAATFPLGPLDPAFVNPLISVLPRLLIGLVAGLIFRSIVPLGKLPRWPRLISGISLAAILGSFTNSILVVLALFLFGYLPLQIGALAFLSNGLPEAVIALVLSITVVTLWWRVTPKQGRARLAAAEDTNK